MVKKTLTPDNYNCLDHDANAGVAGASPGW
jgi:hypothetical protein